MATDLEFDWAVPEDLAEVEAFQAEVYGPDALQSAPGRTRWMYFDHPHGLHLALCRADGRIVAVCGHMPQTVDLDGRQLTAGFGVDFMVAGEYRRRGIGRRFLEMRLERFELSLSTGQTPGMLALYRSVGALDLGPLRQAVFRRRPSLGSSPRRALRDATLWLRGLAAGGVSQDGVEETSGAAGDDDWLAWRYGGAVYGDYCCWRRDGAVAYGREDGVMRVVTRAAGTDRTALLAALARRGPVTETKFDFTGDDLAADLERAGFRLGLIEARLIALTADDELRGRLRPGALELYIDAADADLLRHPA